MYIFSKQDNSDVSVSVGQSEIEQVQTERRFSPRYNTTIVLQDEATKEKITKRGDISKDGTFFIPDVVLMKGTEVVLTVRLPGLGEWVKCGGIVTGISVRGRARGIVGRISRCGHRSEDFLQIWKEMTA